MLKTNFKYVSSLGWNGGEHDHLLPVKVLWSLHVFLSDIPSRSRSMQIRLDGESKGINGRLNELVPSWYRASRMSLPLVEGLPQPSNTFKNATVLLPLCVWIVSNVAHRVQKHTYIVILFFS